VVGGIVVGRERSEARRDRRWWGRAGERIGEPVAGIAIRPEDLVAGLGPPRDRAVRGEP